jgi:DNA invertase Pin-like site-specific DNA recombinase
MIKQKIGYVLSSNLKNDSRQQEESLQAINCTEIIIESVEDKFLMLNKMIEAADPSYILIVSKLSVLGNNASQVYKHVQKILKKNIGLVSLDGIIDTRLESSRKLFAAFQEFHSDIARRLVSNRTPESFETVKPKSDYQFKVGHYLEKIVRMINKGKTVSEIHFQTGVSPRTIKTIRKRYKEDPETIYKNILQNT